MRIPPELIDKVRSEVNILDIVSQKVHLHKSGKNWFGLCPFHLEKTPSFSVNEQKQIFNCFSCHRGGNVYKFIMDTEGLTFPQAFRRVAELGGIHLDPKYLNDESSDNGSIIDSELLDLYAQTNELYHHILVNTQLGQKALDYLHERGIQDDIIENFQLGFAPNNNILRSFVKEKKLDYQLLRRSGLFIERQNITNEPFTKLNDRFQERVIFPIRDVNRHPIAFSGRILSLKDKSTPKYLNSPETSIFNKRRILFNLDKAKSTIRQKKEVILFEGFMDVIAAYRAGVKNGVASMGTSLTNEQITTLSYLTHNLAICYDGDEPGQKAIKRALEIIEPLHKFNLKVIKLPQKLDPDEVLKKYGQTKFQQFITNNYESPMAFFMQYYAQGRNLENENDQLTYITDILKELVHIEDPIERDLYLNRLAAQFGVEYQSLAAQLDSLIKKDHKRTSLNSKFKKNHDFNGYQRTIATVTQAFESKPKYSKIEKAERLLLYRMLHDHNIWSKIHDLDNFSFIHEKYQLLYDLAEGYFNQHNNYKSVAFLDYLEDEKLQNIVSDIEMSEYQGEATEQEINDCINLIMSEYPLDEKIKRIEDKITKAKRMNDENQLLSLIMEKTNLLRQKNALKSTPS